MLQIIHIYMVGLSLKLTWQKERKYSATENSARNGDLLFKHKKGLHNDLLIDSRPNNKTIPCTSTLLKLNIIRKV